MVELDADHVPRRGAEEVFARSHRREHEHLVQVEEHPEKKESNKRAMALETRI